MPVFTKCSVWTHFDIFVFFFGGHNFVSAKKQRPKIFFLGGKAVSVKTFLYQKWSFLDRH